MKERRKKLIVGVKKMREIREEVRINIKWNCKGGACTVKS